MNITPDDFIYQTSKYSTSGVSPFAEKSVVRQNDNNSGSYTSNKVKYDLQSFATNGAYPNWSAGHKIVPLVLRLTRKNAIAGFDALDVPFAVGLKNDYSTIIQSVQIDIQNITISQSTGYLPCLWNARKLLSWSESYLTKKGASYGFSPDSTNTFQVSGAYTGVANSPQGYGILNNVNVQQYSSALSPQSAFTVGQTNWGFYKRQLLTTAFNPNTATVSDFQNESAFATSALNYYKNVGDSKLWYIYAIIPLAEIHPFFKELPLCKSLYSRLNFDMNQCVQQLRLTIAGGALTATEITNTQSNGICPFMIASSTPNGGFEPIVGACIAQGDGQYEFEVALSIGKDSYGNSTYSTNTSGSMSNCEIFLPVYKFKPDMEVEYLSNNTFKHITYSDYQLYNVALTANNGLASLNSVISNGTDNLVRLWVLPYARNTYLGNGINKQTELASPFSSAPGTTLPWAQFTNFNVFVSGKALFNEPINYTFQHFLDEASGNVSLNAGLDCMLTSGLVDQTRWTQSPFICLDISRRLDSERLSPKQIQLQCNILTKMDEIELFIYLESARHITLDTASGQISPEMTLTK